MAAAADDDTANTSPNLPNNKTILFHFTTRKVEHKKHSTPNGQSADSTCRGANRHILETNKRWIQTYLPP